jgi:LysM repeat protein
MPETLGVNERAEPKIEVFPEEPPGGTGAVNSAGDRPRKGWRWAAGLGIFLALLLTAIWAAWQQGAAVKGKAADATQFQNLQGQVQRLEQEWNRFGKEMDALRGEQKVLSDQIRVLKDHLAAIQAKTEKPPEKKETPRAISYKVKKGDTLQSIARRFQVRPEDIRKWNRLGSRGEVTPGKTVTLYPPAS